MATPIVGRDWQFCYERETSFGTNVDTAAVGLPTENMVLKQAGNKHVVDRARGLRGISEADRWQDTQATVPTATIDPFPVTPQILKELLPGILQNSSDWTPTTDVYTMHTKHYSELPDIKGSDEGYFYTLLRKSPVTGDDIMLKGAVPTAFKFTIHPTDNNGVLTLAPEFIGKTYSTEQTASTTITQLALTNLYKWSDIFLFKFSTYDFTTRFHSMEFNVSSGAKFMQDLPERNIVFPRWLINGSFVVENDGTNVDLMRTMVRSKDINEGLAIQLQWGDGTVSSAGEANIEMFVYLEDDDTDYSEGELVTFNFEGVFGGAGEYPFEIEFYAT